MKAALSNRSRFASGKALGRRARTKLRAAYGITVNYREAYARISTAFSGEGDAEIGPVAKVEGDKARCKVSDVIVKVDPHYYRPTEVETLLGDPSKAKAKLGWVPKITLAELVAEMVLADYGSAQRDSLVKRAGFQSYDHHE